MGRILSLLISLSLITTAHSSIVAVIDSGTDMKHKEIAPYAWINSLEIDGNDRDEDRNGYQDDIHGWNFAEGNPLVIDYSYLGRLTPEVRRFFDIQTDVFLGLATEEDIAWVREQVKNEAFLKELQIYGNFMHGTHVGSIAIKGNPKAELLAVKLIPTEVKLPGQLTESMNKGIRERLLRSALGLLASQQMVLMKEIATYVANHKADIANGSFGTGYPQAKGIVGVVAGVILKEPTAEQIHEFTIFFLNKLIEEGKGMVAAAPKTLFIFAAGNDGLNNDEFPTSPTNIQADNVISVAATLGRGRLAPFSNFGEKMVDVAAPGVGIEAAAPGDQYIRVSGTSQAAPFVASLASKLKDINPKLSVLDLRKLIMKTVDEKDWLDGKVLSKGIVNTIRATTAAELSLTMELEEAIKSAKNTVSAVEESQKSAESSFDLPKGLVLPLPSQFTLQQ